MIISGNSGDTGPISFQFLISPSLILFACSRDEVKLNSTAREFPSCGYKDDEGLSRYIPALSSQRALLKLTLIEAALVSQLEARDGRPREVARDEAVVST